MNLPEHRSTNIRINGETVKEVNNSFKYLGPIICSVGSSSKEVVKTCDDLISNNKIELHTDKNICFSVTIKIYNHL